MKPVIALAFLLSLSAIAQTTTTVNTQQVSLVISAPCVNSGKGEAITFAGKVRTVTQFIDTPDGVRHGESFYAVELTGKGATTGRKYSGVGSYDNTYTVTNFVPIVYNENGDFTFTINLHLKSTRDNRSYHNIREFVVSDDGNT